MKDVLLLNSFIYFCFILFLAVVVKECHFESGYCSWTSLGDKEKKWKLSKAKTFDKYPGKLFFAFLAGCDDPMVSAMDCGSTSPGSSPGRGRWGLGKTVYTHRERISQPSKVNEYWWIVVTA